MCLCMFPPPTRSAAMEWEKREKKKKNGGTQETKRPTVRTSVCFFVLSAFWRRFHACFHLLSLWLPLPPLYFLASTLASVGVCFLAAPPLRPVLSSIPGSKQPVWPCIIIIIRPPSLTSIAQVRLLAISARRLNLQISNVAFLDPAGVLHRHMANPGALEPNRSVHRKLVYPCLSCPREEMGRTLCVCVSLGLSFCLSISSQLSTLNISVHACFVCCLCQLSRPRSGNNGGGVGASRPSESDGHPKRMALTVGSQSASHKLSVQRQTVTATSSSRDAPTVSQQHSVLFPSLAPLSLSDFSRSMLPLL